jgi:hypothetical protein
MSITNLLKSIMKNDAMPVTFGMSKWREGGSVVTPEALERLFEVLAKDSLDSNRASGEGRMRPSLIGDKCERKHLFSYMGIGQRETSDGGNDVMDAGTWGHYRWQLAGLSQGWLKDIEVPVSYEPWELRGAMDGMISDGSGWELKTTNSRKFAEILKDNTPVHAHLMQTHAYMRALDLSHFSIVYENRDTATWKEFRIARMEEIDAELDSLMVNLHGHIAEQTLPEMIPSCVQQKGSSYTYCNWAEVCPTVKWKNDTND